MNVQIITGLVMAYSYKIVGALLVLIIGLKIIKVIANRFEKTLEKKEIEKSLSSFIVSISKVVLKILLFVSIASMLGVQMTSFIAILGAASLAVGLALQGSLANFAGGVLILILKPFKAGDFIEGAGHMGTVSEIQVFYTILKTPDNKTIVIPNGNLSNASVTNFSKEDTRRVDFTFGVGYEDDIKKVQEVLQSIVEAHPLILKEPEPFIRLSELADSSVNFTVRVWCDAGDYWTVNFDILEAVKVAFDEQNINIPYPQVDVNMKKQSIKEWLTQQ